MITPDLQTAVTQFLAFFLRPLRRASGGGPLTPGELATFVRQLGADLEVTLGEYRAYGGVIPLCTDVTVPADHAIYVSPTPVSVGPDGDSGVSVTHDEPPMSVMPHVYVVRWLNERADIRTDDEATLRRVLRDLRPPSTWGATGPGPSPEPEEGGGDGGDGPAGGTGAAGGGAEPAAPEEGDGTGEAGYGATVAAAIAALENREEYPDRVDAVESVPPGVQGTVEEYRMILRRFFTYDDEGTYYPKWFGSGGQFPQDTNPAYRRRNVETPDLDGEGIFVLGNVPADFGLPDRTDRQAGEFREFIARIRPGDPEPLNLAFDVVSSAVKTIEVDGSPARDLFDFCFFTVEE